MIKRIGAAGRALKRTLNDARAMDRRERIRALRGKQNDRKQKFKSVDANIDVPATV